MPDKPRRRFSITARLVGGYTLGCVTCLLVVGWLSNHTLRQRFEKKHTELLAQHLAEIRKTIVLYPNDLHEVAELIAISSTAHPSAGFFGRLSDTGNREIAASPTFGLVVPATTQFPPPIPAERPPQSSDLVRVTTPDGELFLLCASIHWTEDRPHLVYQVALNAGHVEEWLTDYNRILGVFIALATTASAFFGWLVARTGLAPVRYITRTVRKITAAGLHQRLGTEPWPNELSPLAAEFDRMLERLDDSFKRLSQFTADAAHEFRTPLNNLMGATSLLLSRDRTAPEYRDALERHLEQYHRLNRMLESLLFLARADGATEPLTLSPTDAGAVAREIAEFFGPMAEEAGVCLTATGEATLAVDEALLRMALINLTANALRFTPTGGHISIVLESSPDNGTLIRVEDTGCGISAEHLPHVFDRLYRVDPARSSGGAGLGLALVSAIMKLHHGTASVTSEPNHGTVFLLRFPPESRSDIRET
ncbi:MAG: heavy metal sensor histidine kinase [Verrucomicrobia bacterium]|nr:heavy metal sensor histidine kinase [Verrucomicrobiota bacterium]